MKYNYLLFFLLLATQAGIAQISGPATGTVGVPVTFSSMKSGTDYNWSFDANARSVDPSNYNPVATSLGAIGISYPSSADMVFDGTNWYGFFTSLAGSGGAIRRADYGTDPTSTTPTLTTLTTVLPGTSTHGLSVVYDSTAGRWFGIAYAAGTSGLIKLDFGATGLTNLAPTMTIIPTNPATAEGNGQLILVRDDGIWHCIHNGSNHGPAIGIGYYNLGASLDALSASTTVDKLFSPVGNDQNLSLYKEGQEWFGIASNDGTPLRRYEFGPSLQNPPNVIDIPTPGTIGIVRGCFCLVPGCDDQLYGFVFAGGGPVSKLDFGNSIRNMPTFTTISSTGFSSGDVGFNVSSQFVYNDTLYMAFGHFNTSTLYTARLMPLTGSTTTHYNSSVTHTFTAPGTYTVNLLVDPARQSGPASYCTQITINAAGGLPQPDPFNLAPSPICATGNVVDYRVPAVSGATSYDWVYTGSGVTFGATTTGPLNSLTFSASATGGTLRVRAADGSGSGPYRDTVIVVNTVPATPGAFTTATTPVCQGRNGAPYEVPAVSGATSYEWSYTGGTGVTFGSTSTTAPANTANFSASAGSGSVQVVAKNSCGTSSPRSTAVTVNPLPAQPGAFTSAPSPVCNGQDNVAYTVPNVSGMTYAWSYTGGTGVTINGSGNSITADFSPAATNGTISVTATNSCGTSAARTTPVTVNPLPQATVSPAGPVDICAGDSATLTAGSGTGYIYEWRDGTTVVGHGSVYKAGTSGSYKVIVTSANCSDSTAAVLVTQYSLPSVTITPGDTSFCAGGMVTLNVATSDTGLSYRWKDGTATIPAATAAFLQVNASGSYSVVAGRTNLPACADSSLPVTVTVFPLPVPDVSWDGLDLHTGAGYTHYQWLKANGDTLTGATDSTYRPLVDGGYLVSVTDSNGCPGSSSIYPASNVHIDPVSAFAAAISIYPNPATSRIYVEAPGVISVSVCSLDGKEIIRVRDTQHAAIDISSLSNGLYLLRVQDQTGKWIKNEKVIKTAGL